ncbi:MAG: molybdopterin-dependent oxidoreductase, partial [Candidatus Marinimicrobia bacterium]|nr:molybdopterin-dependent oxidoreductase [Candidatus Neomarinimicrobiota bacterium]
RDDVQMTSKRHPFQMHYKIGVTKEGKLISADIQLEENAGAYATLSSVVSYRAAMQSMGPYVIPNIRVKSTSYYTNLPPAGAFRGFGSPQATFGHERIMDIIAEKLGLDPVEFRLKNIVKLGDTTLTNHKLTASVGAEETIRQARKAANWTEQRQNNNSSERYVEGMGIATSHYGNCLGAAGWSMDGAEVKIQIHPDGSITVAFGLVEMGQGALTVVAQMTADALGVSMDRISVLPTDSRNVQDSGPSVASRVIVMTGNAILDAAKKMLPTLKSAGAELLECNAQNVEIKDDFAVNKQSGAKVSFDELANYLFTSKRTTDILGWWHVPPLKYDPESGTGEAYFTYSYATQIAKVKVDILTGQVKVEKIWAAHDVGKAINPAGIEGQVEGGIAQGTGWALMEDFKIQDGVVITSNLSTYLLPTTMDVADVETIIIEDPEPQGPWGAKGIGEPTIIPTASAIANAVSHAIGVPMNELPMTPEKVLNAIQTKHQNAAIR